MPVTSLRQLLSGLLLAGVPWVSFAADFDTPENAIRSLEAAYNNRDLEAAAAARDFNEEAILMFQRTNPEFSKDPELVSQLAGILEMAFRNDLKGSGFPNFSELKCSLAEPETISPTLVKVAERCIHPDGTTSVENVLVYNGPKGWRMVGTQDW